ncbi:MAG TPA: NIPSNAP family protein [Acidimicrobiales bacterium]|nr:NIPSNAP family protein [Acidimicrobiales bacterium]
MPYVVDTVEVTPQLLALYLEAVKTVGLAVMTDAGARFVSCATTSIDVGENVDVQIIWFFDDHDQWNVIRRNLVLDPRWYEYAQRTAALRRGGTRRIYHPVAFSSS